MSRRGYQRRQQVERKPGTPAQERARAQAWAAFCAACEAKGISRKRGREWLADEIGIGIQHCIIYEMDETECATVIEICGEVANGKN